MINNQFFSNGKKYKRFFRFNSDSVSVEMIFFAFQNCQFVFDYGNNAQNILLKKDKYFKLKHNIDKCFRILFDNYCIQKIDCSNNGIFCLQLSEAIHLNSFNISKNLLNYLYLEKIIGLVQLNASSNNLRQLDLSNNTKIKMLDLSNNKLQSIDLSNNKQLVVLDLSKNNLQQIHLNQNIQFVNLSYNKLSQLVIPYNSALRYIDLSNNNIEEIIISKQLNGKIFSQTVSIEQFSNNYHKYLLNHKNFKILI